MRRATPKETRYTVPPNEAKWALLEWAGRPAKRRNTRAATSKGAARMQGYRAKLEAAEEAAPWRYHGK